MTPPIIGLLGLAALLVLIAMRVPVAIGMGIVGIIGSLVLSGPLSAGFVLGSQPFVTISPYSLSVIPLFVMMGSFASHAGLSTSLYKALNRLIGHWRGGLASATIGASALFGAVCGSSLATAATMARVAIPEMTAAGYDKRLTSGALAAGGTLGILIPPSIIMVIYAIQTEQSIGRLFLAGMVPGVLAALLYMLAAYLVVRIRPDMGGKRGLHASGSKVAAFLEMGPVVVLFGVVMGGMYGGIFSPTEAAAVGAFGAAVLAWFKGRLTLDVIRAVMIETAGTSAMIFLILIGTSILQFFIESSTLPVMLIQWIEAFGLGPIGVLILIMLVYIVLGCFLDSLSMMLITLPVVFPVVVQMGIDPIWFGVLVVSVVEIGLITPPLGMNLYIIASSSDDIRFETVTVGVLPFLGSDIVRLGLLIAFPALSLTLPGWLM